MASGTLERETEVVATTPAKGEAPSVSDLARGESRDRVEGAAMAGQARAWNARAQID